MLQQPWLMLSRSCAVHAALRCAGPSGPVGSSTPGIMRRCLRIAGCSRAAADMLLPLLLR